MLNDVEEKRGATTENWVYQTKFDGCEDRVEEALKFKNENF